MLSSSPACRRDKAVQAMSTQHYGVHSVRYEKRHRSCNDHVSCVCRGNQQQQPQQQATFSLGEWQVHVLANMPFFTLLLPMFLELEASRLAAGSRPDSQELLKVPHTCMYHTQHDTIHACMVYTLPVSLFGFPPSPTSLVPLRRKAVGLLFQS